MLGGECREIGARGGEDVADARAAFEQQVTGGRGRDPGRAAGTVQERRPDDGFECCDLARERRLRVAERRRGGSERTKPRSRLQRGEVTHLEPPPGLIDISDHIVQYCRFDRSWARHDAWGVDAWRIWNVRAIDPGSGVVREHATVAIEHGRITEVADARGDAPEGAYDGRGRSLLPALIDCHTHLISDTSRSPGFGPPAQMKGEDPRPRELGYLLLARSCRALIESGVTTIRDVGSNDDEAIVMRRAVELGLIAGPRISRAGGSCRPHRRAGAMFGTMYSEADGPWNCDRLCVPSCAAAPTSSR